MGRFPRAGPNLHSLPHGGDAKMAIADAKDANVSAGAASTFVLADAAAGVASVKNANGTTNEGAKPAKESATKKEEVRDTCKRHASTV